MTDSSSSYRDGYASASCPGAPRGDAVLRLHLGWLAAQTAACPWSEWLWGRFDALADELIAERGGPLAGLGGAWRKVP